MPRTKNFVTLILVAIAGSPAMAQDTGRDPYQGQSLGYAAPPAVAVPNMTAPSAYPYTVPPQADSSAPQGALPGCSRPTWWRGFDITMSRDDPPINHNVTLHPDCTVTDIVTTRTWGDVTW